MKVPWESISFDSVLSVVPSNFFFDNSRLIRLRSLRQQVLIKVIYACMHLAA